MTTWFPVAAGLLVVWIGLGLYCAAAFMGRSARERARRSAVVPPHARPSHTPVPKPSVAD